MPAFAGMTSNKSEGSANAHRGARPTGVRQGGAGGAAQARRERDRRLCRAGEGGRQGRSAERGRARGLAAGASARLVPQARGVGGVQGAQARPAGDGLRHAVRAGGFPQHPDPRLDPVPSLAAAEISRPERDQLADHPGRHRNRPVDLLARQRPRYRRRAVAEDDADRPRRLARLGLLRPAVSHGGRGHAGGGRPGQGGQGPAHQAGSRPSHLRGPLRPGQCPHRLGQALAAGPQSHPRLQSGTRRVDDAQRVGASGVRSETLARTRSQGHRRQDGRNRRGRDRRLHRRLRRRTHQGSARETRRRPQRGGRRIRRQCKAHSRHEALMTPTQATAAKAPASASQHANPKSDIEIAQAAKKRPIMEIAREKLGIAPENLEPYGHYKAKVSMDFIKSLKSRPNGKLILVSAITPTPAGEGKTTTTVGLTDALNHIGKKAMLCLREPSLGPCFGMKGGAAGGGYAQVVPMEDINLHFTGDFHAIGSAHNLLAAMIDNHIYWGNPLGIDSRRVTWRRVVDMNDRALRSIVSSLGGVANGFPREDGFDITVASEVMAIFCLASDLDDLKKRLSNIIIGYTRERKPVRAGDINAHGAMAALLKDALSPNLVQTLEGTPAFIHGGPFANIAHGCNSVLATTTALKLCDYVVTEAGFGADLGGEKFMDIKCRKTGIAPDAAVLVATIRALKMHGGVKKEDLKAENLKALEAGMANLARHVENVQKFGIVPIISINRFSADSDAEIALVEQYAKKLGVEAYMADHWAEGGKGAVDVARAVVKVADSGKSKLKLLYPDDMPLIEKIRTIAKEIYRAKDISADKGVRDQLAQFEQMGYGKLPVCIAKTQYSFTTNGDLKGAPEDHIVNVREVRLSAGAEFVVAICGEIMTMPGLPKVPAADNIDVGPDGRIVGLF